MLGEQGRVDQAVPDQAARRRFPALDPEPPWSAVRRRWLRNTVVTVAAIVVLAGLGGGAAYLVRNSHDNAAKPSSRPTARTLPASSAPAANVLAQAHSGPLELSGLRGAAARQLMPLSDQVFVSASTDGRYFMTSSGLLLSFGAHGQLTTTHLPNVSPTAWTPAGVADHDRYAVLQNYSGFVSQEDGSPISIMSLATKKSQQLGSGDQATGDPAAAGVFASIPAQAVATSGSIAVGTNGQWPDGKVVLRDAGKKDVLLGTAAQLDKAVHLRVGTPAYLFPVPDRAGDKIAIEIQPQVNSGSAGVVVVTRTGRVLYTIGGLGRSVSTSWSADGQALATVAQLPTGSELHIWRANAAASVQRFPGNADYGVFSWSPDGKWLLCAISGRNANGEHWVVASATGGPMIVTKGPGYPIAWLGA